MTTEEFISKMKEDENWSPGWDIIEREFEKLYPNQKPAHYGTLVTKRAIFGGEEYLDGYSIYDSPKGYKHLVTFGMTELYAEEEAFGGEWNKWGYEMTMKLPEKNVEDCVWALNMLGNLARYTFETKKFFEPFQYVGRKGEGESICLDRESKITALFIVPDTEIEGLDTIYGRTDFLQVVGITQKELEKLIEDRSNAQKLYDLIKADNPDFITDLNRTKSYF